MKFSLDSNLQLEKPWQIELIDLTLFHISTDISKKITLQTNSF